MATNAFSYLQNPRQYAINAIQRAMHDRSSQLILFSNLVVLLSALFFRAPISEVLLVYWAQSVIIGIFAILRMLTYKLENNEPFVKRMFTSFFFTFHYGMFHLVYFIFIMSGLFSIFSDASTGGSSALFILIGVFIFLLTHFFSFVANFDADSKKGYSLGELMMAPYARIIPMHITIVLGGFIMFGVGFITFPIFFIYGEAAYFGAQKIGEVLILIFFTALKTIADLAAHDSHHALGKLKP